MPGPNFGKRWTNENCYRYAVNQTGLATNPNNVLPLRHGIVDPKLLWASIVKDGAKPVSRAQTPNPGSKPGHYVIAVKFDLRGGNYHVLRRDERTGLWYGKVPLTLPAQYLPRPFDPLANNWNLNAAASRAGLLMGWAGYFWVPDAGLRRR